jgi:hypothetical protein
MTLGLPGSSRSLSRSQLVTSEPALGVALAGPLLSWVGWTVGFMVLWSRLRSLGTVAKVTETFGVVVFSLLQAEDSLGLEGEECSVATTQTVPAGHRSIAA